MNSSFSFLPPKECERPYTITEINDGVARLIESGNTLVWVEAEVSNFRRASSGHCYFKLKDDQCQVSAIIWRSTYAKFDFEPEDGMAVTAVASLRVYKKNGTYQLDVHRMQPAGIGALFAAFEKLKKKLEKEGLFDTAHKKPLPKTVATLGVITAKGGAAVRDIIKVIAKRSPQTTIVLHDVPVQGEHAPARLAAAVENMNAYGTVDCIIIGRGGGSVEDLWAFNDEGLARTIFASDIPVISAVGHEIDFTIADFVADVRAPTPSAAAEMVVPDQQENRRYFDGLRQRFTTSVLRYFTGIFDTYRRIATSTAMRKPVRMIEDARQEIDEARERQMRALAHLYEKRKRSLRHAAAQLQALSPLAVLSRGYSVVEGANGKAVKDAAQLSPNERVALRFHKGRASAEVKDVQP